MEKNTKNSTYICITELICYVAALTQQGKSTISQYIFFKLLKKKKWSLSWSFTSKEGADALITSEKLLGFYSPTGSGFCCQVSHLPATKEIVDSGDRPGRRETQKEGDSRVVCAVSHVNPRSSHCALKQSLCGLFVDPLRLCCKVNLPWWESFSLLDNIGPWEMALLVNIWLLRGVLIYRPLTRLKC